MNLLPYADGSVNFLRLPSVDASREYSAGHTVNTDYFGLTAYLGRIALLHVDGNHAYASVKADLVAWCDSVMSGGWIVVDDYLWPYGDGPKRAVDEYISDNEGRFEVAFAMGGALFLQKAFR
jgi:hypothetical protein